jgi:AraC-like DNA-binding protein
MDQRVSLLLTVMKADPRHGRSLGKMAQSVHLSVPHLSYLFKTEAGTSPGHYFKLIRMEYSATLLATTFFSIKEVMLRVGFSDQSHFVRDFKKIYGMTPTEFRRSMTNGNGHVSGPGAIATGAN